VVLATFRDMLESRGIPAPPEMLREGRDGQLVFQGWTVRWRWVGGGALRVLLHHRMPGDSLVDVAPDGSRTVLPVPGSEVDAGDPDAYERFERAQAEHAARLEREGLRPAPGPPFAGDRRELWGWRFDDDADWRVAGV
jgi:hypothetical protein